jgi:hypothetical protein
VPYTDRKNPSCSFAGDTWKIQLPNLPGAPVFFTQQTYTYDWSYSIDFGRNCTNPVFPGLHDIGLIVLPEGEEIPIGHGPDQPSCPVLAATAYDQQEITNVGRVDDGLGTCAYGLCPDNQGGCKPTSCPLDPAAGTSSWLCPNSNGSGNGSTCTTFYVPDLSVSFPGVGYQINGPDYSTYTDSNGAVHLAFASGPAAGADVCGTNYSGPYLNDYLQCAPITLQHGDSGGPDYLTSSMSGSTHIIAGVNSAIGAGQLLARVDAALPANPGAQPVLVGGQWVEGTPYNWIKSIIEANGGYCNH